MTTEDMLGIIHTYGKTKHRGHNRTNQVMSLGCHTRACGMGTDYDSVVCSLYHNLMWRMLTTVDCIEEDQ